MRFSNYPLCILASAFFFTATTAFAQQWTYYGTDFMQNSYYDADSITHSRNNRATVFIKQTFIDREAFFKKFGIYDDSFEYENHRIALMEIDCSNKAIGVINATNYRVNNEIISTENNDPVHYVPIPATSLFDILFGIVCKP